MKRCLILSSCVMVLAVLIGASVAWAQLQPQPEMLGQSSAQSNAGGATTQALTPQVSNPVITNPTFSFIPASAPPPPGAQAAAPQSIAGTTAVGFESIYSRHMQVYRIPLSHAFTENFKLELTAPYVRKQLKGVYTGEELTANGIGDASIGVKYRYGKESEVQGMTTFSLKLPTGENRQFQDGHERLALGTGSYDFSINQSMAALFGKFLLIANVGYTLTTKGDFTETNNFGWNVKYEIKTGNAFNYLVGTEYYTPIKDLVAYGSAAGLVMGRSHAKETNLTVPGLGNRDEDVKDSLKTLDVIAGVMYRITEKIGLRLGVILPVWTQFDSDAIDKQGRDVTLDFGGYGRF